MHVAQRMPVEVRGQFGGRHFLHTMIPGKQTQVVQLSDKCLDLPTKPSCWLST